MSLLLLVISLACILLFFLKRYFVKNVQIKYEKFLLKGDKQKAHKYGKIYYNSISETTKKSKGVIDIEEKISQDLKAFRVEWS